MAFKYRIDALRDAVLAFTRQKLQISQTFRWLSLPEQTGFHRRAVDLCEAPSFVFALFISLSE